jgi:hypothetical protein
MFIQHTKMDFLFAKNEPLNPASTHELCHIKENMLINTFQSFFGIG